MQGGSHAREVLGWPLIRTESNRSHTVPQFPSSPVPPTLYELYRNNAQTFGCRFARMEFARLETALLKDVTDDYYYGCSCQSCLHTARLSLSKLRSHLGADFPLRKIRERLKCQICTSRKVTTTFLGPHQKGGNLCHLFEKKAK